MASAPPSLAACASDLAESPLPSHRLARSLPSNCNALSSSLPADLSKRRGRATGIQDSPSRQRLLQQPVQLGSIHRPGDTALRMLLSAACKRLKASPVDQVCGKLGVSAPSGGISLAESAPSGGVHHTRRAPTPAASLTDELDAFDTVLAQLVSGEMPFSLDIIDMSAEVTVLLLQQAWRQWRQEPVAKSSQSLTRAARVCAAIASREQCRPPLLAHGGLPALTCMLRGRWEGDAAPGVAPGRPTVSPTSMAVVEAASQARCCRHRTVDPLPPAPTLPAPPPSTPSSWLRTLESTPPHPSPSRTLLPTPPLLSARAGGLPAEHRRGLPSIRARRGRHA